MKKQLLFAALMALSPAAFSQSYTGTVNDLNTIFNPPDEIQGTLCAHADADGNEHSSKVCRDGVSAARWMAEKYAKKAGQYLGCIDGFYQGVWDGYLMGKNPTPDMIAEAEAYIAQATMKSALERGEQKAHDSSVTESADDIIKRYRQVLRLRQAGQQVMPNKEPDLSSIPDFAGFNNGYEYDISQRNIGTADFSDAINAGYVNANSKIEDKLAARKAYMLQGTYARNLCDVNKTIFGRRNMPQLSIWDFFNAKRQYDFQKYGWKNGDWAYDVYHQVEQTIAQYQNYERIKDLMKTIVVKTPITETRVKLDANGNPILIVDENGQPVLDANGRKQYEMEEVIVDYDVRTERVKIDANDVKELQAIYEEGFLQAYNRYYAKQYASLEYHKEGLDKYQTAKVIGQAIGEDVASHMVKKKAYDDKYREESRSAYDKLAEKIYLESFYKLLGVFENNPVVELDDMYISGTINDGIFTRGESLEAQISVTNLGEVASPVSVRVDSNVGVIGNPSGYTFTPAPLASATYNAGVLATISNDANLRNNVSARVRVQNASNLDEISSELQVSQSQALMVRDYAEIVSKSADVDVLNGTVEVKVKIINPSDVETPALPNVKVVLTNMNGQADVDMMKIGPGDNKYVTLKISGLDPIELIEKGRVDANIYLTFGNNSGKLIDKTSVSAQASGASADAVIVSYFNGIVTGTVTNTGSVSRATRIAQLVEKIEDSLDNSLYNDKIKWKKQHMVNRTIVGDLQSQYQAAKVAGQIGQKAQQEYDALAKLLAKKTNNRGRTRIRGLDKHFLRALKVFSPTLSDRYRDHKN